MTELTTFAERYAEAWCSQNPESVAAFYAKNGSLSVNDGPPAVGRAAIAEVAQGFMTTFPDMIVTMDEVSPGRAVRESAFESAATKFGRSTMLGSSQNQKATSTAPSTNVSSSTMSMSKTTD